MALTNNLKQIRLEKDLKQEELAFAIGTTGSTIGRIERGERNASLEMGMRLAQYLQVPIEKVFSVE